MQHLLNPGWPSHTESVIELRGPVEVGVLIEAVQAAARAHDAIWFTIHERDGTAWQTPPTGDPAQRLLVVDHRTPTVAGPGPDRGAGAVVDRMLADIRRAPFDLASGPLLRAVVLTLGPDRHILALVMHHLVSDGPSWVVLRDDVSGHYRRLLAGEPPPPTGPTPTFADHLRTRRSTPAPEALAYWTGQLAGVAPLDLPTDRPRPTRRRLPDAVVAERTCDLGAPGALEDLARRLRVTPFMVLVAAWSLVLGRRAGQDDVCLGSPVSARVDPYTSVVGMFVSTLALRVDLGGDPSFADLVTRVRRAVIGGLQHPEVPYEELLGSGVVRRQRTRTPVFQTMVALNEDHDRLDFAPGVTWDPYPGKGAAASYDLELAIWLGTAGPHLHLHLDAALFDQATGESLLAEVETVLRAVVARPDLAIGDCQAPSPFPVSETISTSVGADAIAVTAAPVPALAQERLWFFEQLTPGTAAYALPAAIRLTGEIDPALLRRCVEELAARHDSLRASFTVGGEGPLLHLADRVEVPWREEAKASPDDAAAWFRAEADVPFDLTTAPLLRATLARLGPGDHLLQLTTHHLISDGWSLSLLVNDLAAVYRARSTGAEPPAPPPVRYVDAAAWQRARLERPEATAALDRWIERLRDVPPLDLPTDHPRPVEKRFRGDSVRCDLDPVLGGRLRSFAAANRTTLFTVLLAGWQATLGRTSGGDRFAVGVPTAGRPRPELEAVVGLFTNTVVCRADLREAPSFLELTRRARSETVRALADQEVPFERIVQHLAPDRDLSRSVVFQTLLALQNFGRGPGEGIWPDGVEVDHVGGDVAASRFDTALYCYERDDGAVDGWLQYDTDLFEASTMTALAARFVTLLTAALDDPAVPVDHLDLVTVDERRRLDRFSHPDPAANPPAPATTSATTLDGLVGRQAALTPDRPAVIAGDRVRSYADLDRRATASARLLRRLGVGRGDLVGILVEPGPDTAVAMLATLRAGAAYLPLDPGQPPARLDRILSDARPALLVLDGETAELVAELETPPTVGLDRLVAVVDQADDEPDGDLPAVGESWPAYVIYTSGSTGRPKGVVVAHRQALTYLRGLTARIGFEPGAGHALVQSLAFDFSITAFYGALATGGTVHLLPSRSTGPELARYLADHHIDYLKMTPTHLAALGTEVGAEALLPRRALLLGGEASTLDWAGSLAAHGVAVHNHYGPTEATVGVTTHAVPATRSGPAGGTGTPGSATTPIGRPLPGARAHVLDDRLRPVPVGVVGELYLGGDRLALGYLGQPGLTADRFVPDPFADEPGGRLYRTGDRARWDRDGNLHFLGRNDDQVKIRGYRVEPAEVAAALARLPGAAQAVVTVRDGALIGYIERAEPVGAADAATTATATATAGEPTESELKALLAEDLPDYLIPSRLLWLDRLPRQDHGKVDRSRLPEPPPLLAGNVEPDGPVEETIAAVLADLLGRDAIGATDDFFDLGGHSLLAVQAVARIGRELPGLPRPLAVIDLFKHRTVRELAALATGDDHDRTLLHELTRTSGTGRKVEATLVCVPYGGASAVVYQPLADALPAGWRLLSVAVPGHEVGLDEDIPPLAETAARCVEELAAVDGPLVLYGHCGPGSALVVEIGRQLAGAGRPAEAVYVGGAFPFARPRGGLLGPVLRLRIMERIRSDRIHANRLRAMGAELGELDEEQSSLLVRAMRRDAELAEDYFGDLLERGADGVGAPVISVVGSEDPSVEFYQERFQEWHLVSPRCGLVVLDEAGHYFLRYRAAELAGIVTTVHRRLDDDHGLDHPTWRLADRSTREPQPSGDPAGVDQPNRSRRPEPDAGPQPSMARFVAVAIGQLLSMTGTALTEFALPLSIYLETGSIARYALFLVLGLVPGITAAPVIGAVVDRVDRRRAMLAGDLAAGLVVLALTVVVWSGRTSGWHLYAFVGVISVALSFQRVAYQSAVPQLVPKHYLGHANGVIQTTTGTAHLIVPLVAVSALAAVGLRGILLIDTLSYVVAIGVLLVVRFPRRMAQRRRESLGAELAGGAVYSFGRPPFRAMLLFFVVLNLFLSPLVMLISPLVLATRDLATVGRVALAGGLGGLLGGLAMAIWGGPRRRRFRAVLVTAVGLGLGSAVIGATSRPPVIAAGLLVVTASLTLMNGVYATIVQTKVPQRLHGRVFALNMAIAWSTLPVGWLVIAPLATSVAEPALAPGGALAPTVGRLIGTGPGRGIALVYLALAVALVTVVAVARLVPILARFDDDVPDAPPDDVVGLDRLRERGDPAPQATDGAVARRPVGKAA